MKTNPRKSYRIWRVNMQTSKTLGASSLWPVVVIILESGAIYSSTLLLLLVTYLSNSQSQYIGKLIAYSFWSNV